MAEPDMRRLKHFAKANFNKHPATLQNFWAPEERELFAVIKETCELSRVRRYERASFYVESESILSQPSKRFYSGQIFNPANFLPGKSDTDLDAYRKRLRGMLGERRFGLQLNQLESEPPLRRLFQPMVDALLRITGRPRAGVDLVAFAGDYRHTPSGIHKDSQHVFTFICRGHKKFSLWPHDQLADRPELNTTSDRTLFIRDDSDFKQVTALADQIGGKPSDLLYWPPSAWHRSEPTSGMCLTITLGLNFDNLELVEQSLSYRPTEKIDNVRKLAKDAEKKWREQMRAAHTELSLKWIANASNGGYKTAIRRRPPVTPQLRDHFRVIDSSSLLVEFDGADSIYIAANGRSMKMTCSRAEFVVVRDLLSRLSRQSMWRTSDFASLFEARLQTPFAEDACNLLGVLHSWSVIEVLAA